MKTTCTLVILFLTSTFTYSQVSKPDSIVPGKGTPERQLEKIKDKKIHLHSDSASTEPQKSALDTTVMNKYGDLLDDDTVYNKKYPLWKPAVEVVAHDLFTFGIDRYVLRYDYSIQVGIDSWKRSFKEGWEWDQDRFGINFLAHPYSGTLSFNAARSNGYSYFQSFPFAVGGSLLWEYFGENTRPSYNDIVNTPVNGAFIGEILYRLSSNILDDRTRGSERVFREIFAGLINPMRGVNRLLQGKSFRHTNKEVYQKEPLNISLYAGIHKINYKSKEIFGNGPTSQLINFQFDYGNPFENRKRKPFDFFKLRTELNFGVGRKILDNLTGYGILFGKNFQSAKISMLAGGFQYYDYWDNPTFELAAIGFGGGVFTKIPFSKKINLFTNAHIGFIPLAGNSTINGPDTTQIRDYTFGDGFEGKIESTINVSNYASASLIYNFFFIHTYVGSPGNNTIGILKPRITVHLYKDLSIGYEHFVYFDGRDLKDHSPVHTKKTEEKIFLLLYLEDPQRRGHYN